MMELIKDQLPQLVGGLTFLGIDAGLRKQGFGIDLCLFQ